MYNVCWNNSLNALSFHPTFTDEEYGTVVTVLAICSKTVSNVGWFINYVQNMELFPTSARVSGMNFCVTVSTVVGTSAPYVILLVRALRNDIIGFAFITFCFFRISPAK